MSLNKSLEKENLKLERNKTRNRERVVHLSPVFL